MENEIINLLIEMQTELTECNIRVDELITKVPGMSDRKKIAFLAMLKDIHSTDYALILKVRACVSPEMWENYKTLKIKGLQEQELLKQAQLNLRKNWFERRAKIAAKSLKPKNQKEEGSDEG